MNKAATQALTSLLPTLSVLPPELIDLAVSLVAQSQNKAGSLKQEEEVARCYACAHLACERLKTKLNLPAITSRPPCPPRTYKKLYAFLDSALVTKSPRKRARESVMEDDSRIMPTEKTSLPSAAVTKRRRPAQAVKANGMASMQDTRGARHASDELKFLLPAVRGICESLGNKAAYLHVYTAVCTIFEGGELQEGLEILPAFINAIALVTLRKLNVRLPARPVQLASEKWLEFVNILHTVGLNPNSSGDDGGDLVTSLEADTSRTMRDNEKEWRLSEWYENIQEKIVLSEDMIEDEVEASGVAGLDDDDLLVVTASMSTPNSSKKRKMTENDDGRLKPGLGTMYCDAVDWLNDDRRAAYKLWRRDVMLRIEGMA